MRHARVLVLGGSGFIGRHLVAALVAAGAEVIVPTRRRERAKHLILLPTVDLVECDPLAGGVLGRLAAGCDAMVNLVGVLHGPDFRRPHVELALAAVNACRAAGVKRLLHVSALGASRDAPSEYLRSKGMGEEAVLAADDLAVTVFRPSVVFGPDDSFLNLFARLAAVLPVLALARPDARFQPVYVGDVVRAMLAALMSREAAGQRYDLCGPKVYTLAELAKFVCAATGRWRLVIGLPDTLAYAQAWMMEFLPVPLITRDNLRSMQVPSVCDCPLPFGIEPVALETAAPAWLARG
jgi:NADH dehydrogenase